MTWGDKQLEPVKSRKYLPEWPDMAWNGVIVSQSVIYILQSPAPPEIRRLDRLDKSSMKHMSRMVPSCIDNSASPPSNSLAIELYLIILMVLSLEPVANRSPVVFHARLSLETPLIFYIYGKYCGHWPIDASLVMLESFGQNCRLMWNVILSVVIQWEFNIDIPINSKQTSNFATHVTSGNRISSMSLSWIRWHKVVRWGGIQPLWWPVRLRVGWPERTAVCGHSGQNCRWECFDRKCWVRAVKQTQIGISFRQFN